MHPQPLGRALILAVLALSLITAASGQLLPWGHKQPDYRNYGKITAFHLDAPLHAPPLSSLAQFPLMNFTYALYPTAESGAGGMVPGNTSTGAPLLVTVERGLYDHHTGTQQPLEFQVIKSDLAQLPKAPGGKGLLVYSVLYTGEDLGNCTGVVDLMELKHSKLRLAAQFSYDCAGGAGASWDQKKRQLTLRAAHYAAGDKPCCPTLYDHVVFKLDGAKVNTGDIQMNNQ